MLMMVLVLVLLVLFAVHTTQKQNTYVILKPKGFMKT